MMAHIICTRAGIFRNICQKQLRVTTIARNSSHLPQKTGPPDKDAVEVYAGAQPVQQKLLSPIPVEYHGVPSVKFNDETIWLRVFKFPYLDGSRFAIRAKVYLSAMAVSAIAYRLYSFLSLGFYESKPVTSVSILSICSFSALLLLGNLSKKIICQVYVSENLDYIRMSRFTFFGKRRDLVLPITCVLPMTETNATDKPLFLSIRTILPDDFDDTYDFCEFYDDKFLICIKFGGITDVEKFEHVFGRILTKKLF